MSSVSLFPTLANTVQSLSFETISQVRKNVLDELVSYVVKKHRENGVVLLNFICTHNSRRSQLAQVWGQTAAYYYQIDAVCYSGGVEVTAFKDSAIGALKTAGFSTQTDAGLNPVAMIAFNAKSEDEIAAFSKLYDNSVNPTSNFAAILTCSAADENCPFIPGAELRIALPYEDPKIADGRSDEAIVYAQRSLEIATEMFYTFSQIKDQ